MVIDLSDIPFVHSGSYRDECRVKGNKLLTELNRININMSTKHNYIIIPVSIYNLLEINDSFISLEKSANTYDGPIKVGLIGEFICYLDIHLPPNEIIVSWDRQTSRNVKLDSILNDTFEKEKRIKVIS